MKTIECPKCHKSIIRRKTRTDTNFWFCHCLWCGYDFNKAKTHVGVEDKRWIEGL